MKTHNVIQREIEEKWNLIPRVDSPIHKAGIILPPGDWERFDPFLLMAEDNMRKGAFDFHPHRGIETVSYMIDGVMDHRDNAGNKGTLNKGDTQWMSAGKGLLHLEEAPEGHFAHLLQLWVNLPADKKMSEPRYQDILYRDTPIRNEDGVQYRVISGSSGDVKSNTQNYANVTMVEITIKAGHTAKQDLKPDYNGFLYVLEGNGIFGADQVRAGKQELLWMKPSVEYDSEIQVHAIQDLKVLLIAGKPLREPVFAHGPFVMNTEEQIIQAFADYRSGKFGEWIH
ncbi:pirin [Leptospira tipperaryensis]|uniref:Pirin n=1 Tax=Leptospira tipperaryensis TaxID=2564040 RepID=A0A1D7UTU8_9LEPT|nr:pirin family protein [Leptospira tipperaryensis]AOP33030.1 pirin [Leptospira tipperaryensis]